MADPGIFEGGADEKNQEKEGADGTKMRTFKRKLLEKSGKSNPKGDATAPTAPLDPPLYMVIATIMTL